MKIMANKNVSVVGFLDEGLLALYYTGWILNIRFSGWIFR